MPKLAKVRLLEQVRVVDSYPAGELRQSMGKLLAFAVPEDFREELLRDILGWWYGEVWDTLLRGGPAFHSFTDLHAFVHSRAAKYKRAPLEAELQDVELPGFSDPENDSRPFVRQLTFIRISRPRVDQAVQDYYRAFEQRSLWQRRRLVSPDELGHYDSLLRDKWRRRRDIALDELADIPSDDAYITCGRDLYRWALDNGEPLRDCREPYVLNGSYHLLAEQREVGWHPSFLALLEE